jgi:hypothetical protein
MFVVITSLIRLKMLGTLRLPGKFFGFYRKIDNNKKAIHNSRWPDIAELSKATGVHSQILQRSLHQPLVWATVPSPLTRRPACRTRCAQVDVLPGPWV